MKMNLIPVLAVCFAVGLTGISEPADAKKKNKKKHKYAPVQETVYSHPSGKGFPNGRPWQALDDELDRIKHKLYVIDEKVDLVLVDTGNILDDTGDILGDTGDILDDTAAILEGIDDIKDGIDDIDTDLGDVADGVSMLTNTLEVQVSVGPISEAIHDDVSIDEVTDGTVVLYVQVIQNGVGVDMLTAEDFMYANSFPESAASFCGELCFTEGLGGQYRLLLVGDGDVWTEGTHAGTLAVQYSVVTTEDGETSNGASQVTFEIPPAPVVEPPPA
ncbi:MAG: hypothetical protein JSU75_12210 [Gammaproteobacteria bacterium]|nr:MAG: hypothetical protein JSU75_12210 [Gammaproteobacteria bacterium]